MNPLESTTLPATALETIETAGVLTKKELALERAGATREVAYQTMVAGLQAESMTVDKFGDEHMTPDHSSRLKAAELISKLNGDLKDSPTVDARVVNISIGSDGIAALVEMVRDVATQLAALRASGQQTGEIIDVEHSVT